MIVNNLPARDWVLNLGWSSTGRNLPDACDAKTQVENPIIAMEQFRINGKIEQAFPFATWIPWRVPCWQTRTCRDLLEEGCLPTHRVRTAIDARFDDAFPLGCLRATPFHGFR